MRGVVTSPFKTAVREFYQCASLLKNSVCAYCVCKFFGPLVRLLVYSYSYSLLNIIVCT